jgi:hypothetical protein
MTTTHNVWIVVDTRYRYINGHFSTEEKATERAQKLNAADASPDGAARYVVKPKTVPVNPGVLVPWYANAEVR